MGYGWFRSFKEKKPVDKNGNPIPWMTYPFIDFIKPKLKNSFEVFEYGCGNSTLFFADRVNSVMSVEHDKGWFRSMLKIIPDNVELLYQSLEYGGEYCQACINQKIQFDIVIIDGRDRVNCTKYLLSSRALKEDGIIVFDNSDRIDYNDAYSLLSGKKYKRIDFDGMGPINSYKWRTSLFYRNNNILGL